MAKRKKITEDDIKEKKIKFEKIADNLEEISVDNFLKDNFLPYSWSVILDRALTDVTGLKPVQRRILYTMYEMGLSPNSSRSKVATLAGRVLAYHPHGDASVSDALKNIARPHIFRVPLIDGKGDFGSPGTPGAAARYIEARLNKAAWLNVEDIAEHATRMVPNYDDSTVEPVEIPVKWPVSIVNGGSGIAVGYAANMPSHNPTEIMKACKALLRNPDMTDEALSKIVLGPDFNMGGTITSNDGIKQYLKTGSGSFKIRANYEVTPGARNSHRIEFYEIPFGTYPEKIIEEIQKQSDKGKFAEISTYKDLSDLKHPIRVIIDTKPSSNYKKVLQDLFKYTSLETSFSSNMTTVVENKPVQSSMKNLLLNFIEFRKECIANKTKYILPKRENRLHLIEGLLKTLLDIDKAISIIRKSDNTEIANEKLQKAFKLDKDQAEYVLSLQLRRLTKMDSVALKNEKKDLVDEVKYLNSLLSDYDVLQSYLLDEFDNTLKVIGDERKTEINSMSAEDFAESEKSIVKELKNLDKNLPCYITRFANGGIMKTSEPFTYMQGAKKLANSPIIEQIKMNTQDFAVIIGSDGIGHKVPLSHIFEDKLCTPKDMGITIDKGVRIVGVAKYASMKSDIGIAIGTKNGGVKIAKTDFPKGGEEFPVITLDDSDEVVDTRWLGKALTGSYFTFVSKAGNILVFDAKTIRASGHKAGSVKGMKLKGDKDEVIHFGLINDIKNSDNMLVTYSGITIKSTLISEIPTKNKGGMGVATQIFKSGETELKTAYAGLNVATCVNKSTHNTISVPPVQKRSARGTDFNIDIILGTSEPVIM